MGSVIRSAAAFDLTKTFLISKDENFLAGIDSGEDEYSSMTTTVAGGVRKKRGIRSAVRNFNLFGDKGTKSQMEFDVFGNLTLAKEYFVAHNISVCGVEITESSQSIVTQPFRGDTVFILGNEG